MFYFRVFGHYFQHFRCSKYFISHHSMDVNNWKKQEIQDHYFLSSTFISEL